VLYERFSEQRPPGWTCSGPGALCALAELGRAERLAGDVARLRIVAEEMRVVAREHDPARLGDDPVPVTAILAAEVSMPCRCPGQTRLSFAPYRPRGRVTLDPALDDAPGGVQNAVRS
jgi:hypothetical protein